MFPVTIPEPKPTASRSLDLCSPTLPKTSGLLYTQSEKGSSARHALALHQLVELLPPTARAALANSPFQPKCLPARMAQEIMRHAAWYFVVFAFVRGGPN